MARLLMRAMLIGSALLIAGCSEQDAKGPPPGQKPDQPVEVGVVTLKPEAVPRSVDLAGRVAASATAEIRPQVDGIVQKLAFQEGRPVKAGDVLYQLDAAKFQATVDAARANLQKAEATVSGAQDTVTRYERLATQNAVSAQEIETARTALLQGRADRAAAQADLETAQINLANATIKAPISGMIGTSSISVGALVGANQTASLATIRQIDPVYVDLVETSANLLDIRERIRSGELGRDSSEMPKVKLTLENGRSYERTGRIEVFDLVISETTGTFPIRAVFDNPERVLLPGMFVRARVDLGQMQGAYRLPQRAVTRNAAGEATANFVGKDDTVENRVVKTDGTAGNDWIVTEGVKEGDRLIVDGLQKISPGAKIKPVDAKIDDNGVVPQTIADQNSQQAPEAGK